MKCIFYEISTSFPEELAANTIQNKFKKNQTIFFQGNPSFGLHCVYSGKVKIVISNMDGKESILRLLTEGDIFGHSSLFSGEHYNASAIALEDSVINFYKKDFILNITKKYPSIALNFLTQISHVMESAELYKSVLIHKNVRERLAGLLISLQTTFGVEDVHIVPCVRLDIILTREEMAGMIGTTIETLVRLITEFKNENIISQSGKYICIVDEKKLLEFANK